MDPESRVNGGKPFACNVCHHRFAGAQSMRRHKQAVHDEGVFKCPQPGCQFSSSWKENLKQHLKGFHGTAGSFACDHPGCTFRTTWRKNVALHKRQVHSFERPFACDHTGCEFRAKRMGDLSRHKNMVHLNIRDKLCHVCGKRFKTNAHLRVHMATHEGDGHEVAKCEECSVNLRITSSHKPRPAVPNLIQCDHQGCDYKSRWKSKLSLHQKQAHSAERPFSCRHTGCSVRCKTKSQLTNHQKQVHLNIKSNRCHLCNKRFFSKCEDCVINLKKNYRMSLAKLAADKRKVERKETHSTPANTQGTECHEKSVGGTVENAFALKEEQIERQTHRLNVDLIEMHMDMQLLSSV